MSRDSLQPTGALLRRSTGRTRVCSLSSIRKNLPRCDSMSFPMSIRWYAGSICQQGSFFDEGKIWLMPNIGAKSRRCSLLLLPGRDCRSMISVHHQEPLANEKFGVQNGTTRSAAYGIVTEQHEFVAEDRTCAQSPNRNRHALTGIPVAQCLGTIRFRAIDQGMLWRRRQLELLWFGFIVFPCGDDVLFACIGA